MKTPSRRLRSRTGLAILISAAIALGSATVAGASVPVVWSGAEVVPVTSPGTSISSAMATLSDGSLLMISTVRQVLNDNSVGLVAHSKQSGSAFVPAGTIVNGQSDPIDGAISVDGRELLLVPGGSGAVAVWQTDPTNGSGGVPKVGASVYSGGTWSTPTYVDRPAGSLANLFDGPDGTAHAVVSGSDGVVYLADLDSSGSWTSFTAVPGSSTVGDLMPPIGAATSGGDIWLAFVGGASSLSTIGRVGGTWTAQQDLGAGDPNDYDPFDIAISTLPSASQQPVILFGESSSTPSGLKVARRGDDGVWSTETLLTPYQYPVRVGLAAAVDGTITAVAIHLTSGVSEFRSPGFGQPWSGPIDLSPTNAPDYSFSRILADQRGDVTVILGASNGSENQIDLIGIRAGTGTVSSAVLSTETPAGVENQGGVDFAIDPYAPLDSFPVAWSSFSSDDTTSYGAYWIDGVGVFPPGPDPTPITPTTTTTVPGGGAVTPAFTG